MAAIRKRIEIKVDQETHSVLADFDFIDRVEQRVSLMAFLQDLESGRMKISDTAWVLFCALNGTESKLQYREIGEWCLANFEKSAREVAKLLDEVTAPAAEAAGGAPGNSPAGGKTPKKSKT